MTCNQVEELRQLRKEREEWRKEKAGLLAHCETMREFLGELWADHSLADKAKHVYQETPQQSLAEHDEQVIEQFCESIRGLSAPYVPPDDPHPECVAHNEALADVIKRGKKRIEEIKNKARKEY